MKELLPVGCVIMASGLSQRFGSNKLLAPFCGEPMLCRAFAATDTPKLSARIVVTRSDEVAQLCRSRNVPVLLHDLPGRNDTVRLGLSALLEQVPELFAWLVFPFLGALLAVPDGHSLFEVYAAHPADTLWAMCCAGRIRCSRR